MYGFRGGFCLLQFSRDGRREDEFSPCERLAVVAARFAGVCPVEKQARGIGQSAGVAFRGGWAPYARDEVLRVVIGPLSVVSCQLSKALDVRPWLVAPLIEWLFSTETQAHGDTAPTI
jgi:hypothetical protein